MAYVAGVAVEHEDGEGLGDGFVGGPDEEGVKGFTVGGGDLQFVIVGNSKLWRTGHASVCAGAHGDVAGVDKFAEGVSDGWEGRR